MNAGDSTYQKDVAAFNEAVGQMRRQLLLAAQAILHDAEQAEDAVQETLMRCWLVRHRLGHIGELPPFALQTVRNLCIDLIRQQKGQGNTVALDALTPADEPNAERMLVLKEQQKWMMECLRRLPTGARAAIQMKGIEGLSYAEMAEILGTTEATVRAKVA